MFVKISILTACTMKTRGQIQTSEKLYDKQNRQLKKYDNMDLSHPPQKRKNVKEIDDTENNNESNNKWSRGRNKVFNTVEIHTM